jgi:hypothetical protein
MKARGHFWVPDTLLPGGNDTGDFRRLDGHQSGAEYCGKEKNPSLFPGKELRFLGRPILSVVTVFSTISHFIFFLIILKVKFTELIVLVIWYDKYLNM